jgi:hypothetical protein
MRCTTQLLLLSRTHHYNKIKSSTLQPLTKWTQKRGYARRRLEFLTEEEEGDFEMPFHIYEDKKQKKYRMEKEKEEYKKHLEKYFSKASEEEKRRALGMFFYTLEILKKLFSKINSLILFLILDTLRIGGILQEN